MAKRDEGAGSILAFAFVGARPALRPAVVAAGICALAALAVRVWIQVVGPLPGDWWVHMHAATVWQQPAPVRDVTAFFSVIGTPMLAVVTLAIGAIYAVRAEGLRGLLFLALCAAAVAANGLLKELSGPTPLHFETSSGHAGLNFPSGHVVYATTSLGALAVLARRAGRLDVVVPLLLVIAGMGPARVIGTAHFVSDVVAAYLVGFAWLVVAAALTLAPAASKVPRRAPAPAPASRAGRSS